MEPLFHGTAGDFASPSASQYDRIWWTAQDSAVAQTYIPPAYATTALVVDAIDMKQRVVPCRPGVSVLWDLATMIQPELLNSVHAEYDIAGHAKSYTIADAHPGVGDICVAIENIFGYLPLDPEDRHRRTYRLRVERIDDLGRNLYAAANWKRPGFLWIVQAPDNLRIFDMTGESAGDLSDPHYHQVNKFTQLREAGYDGVIINDFTSSANWGTVEHVSHGFFAQAIPKLQLTRIPASNFDWGPLPSDFLGVRDSPEFKAWSASQRRAA